MIVSARIVVPASTRNDRTWRHVVCSSTRITGRRYGGSSSTSVGRGPRSTVRRSTAAAVSAAVTDSRYIASSVTAARAGHAEHAHPGPEHRRDHQHVDRAAARCTTSAAAPPSSACDRCGSRACASPSRPGTAQEKPDSIGTNDLPCRPTRAHDAIDDERHARQVADVLHEADEQEQQPDLRHERRRRCRRPRSTPSVEKVRERARRAWRPRRRSAARRRRPRSARWPAPTS